MKPTSTPQPFGAAATSTPSRSVSKKEAVHVSVRLDADASREALAALVKHATLWSPVANTLHNPVHLSMSLRRQQWSGRPNNQAVRLQLVRCVTNLSVISSL